MRPNLPPRQLIWLALMQRTGLITKKSQFEDAIEIPLSPWLSSSPTHRKQAFGWFHLLEDGQSLWQATSQATATGVSFCVIVDRRAEATAAPLKKDPLVSPLRGSDVFLVSLYRPRTVDNEASRFLGATLSPRGLATTRTIWLRRSRCSGLITHFSPRYRVKHGIFLKWYPHGKIGSFSRCLHVSCDRHTAFPRSELPTPTLADAARVFGSSQRLRPLLICVRASARFRKSCDGAFFSRGCCGRGEIMT